MRINGAQERTRASFEINTLGVEDSKKIVIENENPGATAIATGAKDVVEGVYLCGDHIAAFPILAMHWGALV
ncbi:hypothetical protein [Fluviibacterium sp. S390]|uniref:hypothetical protein n=1 Tax=Fluviibacterium sp. S390 TaxID=3415139 RepID=UPI003C7BBDDB